MWQDADVRKTKRSILETVTPRTEKNLSGVFWRFIIVKNILQIRFFHVKVRLHRSGRVSESPQILTAKSAGKSNVFVTVYPSIIEAVFMLT